MIFNFKFILIFEIQKKNRHLYSFSLAIEFRKVILINCPTMLEICNNYVNIVDKWAITETSYKLEFFVCLLKQKIKQVKVKNSFCRHGYLTP